MVAFKVHFRLRFDFGRVRQVVNYCIKNILYTFVFKGCSTVGREEVKLDRARANAFLDCIDTRLFTFQVLLQEIVVLFNGHLDQLLTPLFNNLLHVFRNIAHGEYFGIVRRWPDVGLARQQVDDAFEIVFNADRQHHDNRVRREHILDLLDNSVVIRTDAVKLVDKNNACNFRVVGVTPVRFRLWLHAAGSTEHANAAVENLQ